MDGKKNHQQRLLNVVAVAVSIQPYLFLPKVVVSTPSNSYEGMDHRVCCVEKREAPKISPTKIERYVLAVIQFHSISYNSVQFIRMTNHRCVDDALCLQLQF